MFTCTHTLGVENVLHAAAQLESLAQRVGQDELSARFKFQFSVPYFGSKQPHAVLFHGPAGEVQAGVFALEYRFFGYPTGVLVPADSDGDLTVISLPEHRLAVAEQSAKHLIERGARLVLLSFKNDFAGNAESATSALKVHTREIRRTLPLRSTVDETLAQMGARSRRNLRHAARQAVKLFGATMDSDAMISEADLIALNRICDYRVPDAVAQRLYRNVRTLPGCFLSGLRARNGDWLSVLGGRRHGSVSIVDWQMNRANLGSVSIGTAMRLFQIQHEVERGATTLQYTGGTPHSMQNAFTAERVTDCLWLRKPYGSLTFLAAAANLVPSSNGLRALLAAPSRQSSTKK